MKRVENELCQHRKQHQRTVSTAVIWPRIWFLLLLCFPSPTRYTLSVTFVALVSWCARWEQSRGLNSASVFRCTNGITEAKMAGGERWVHSRQLHTTAAAVALPNHSTVMVWEVCVFQRACVCAYVYVRMREGRQVSERVFVFSDIYGRTLAINCFCSQAFVLW